MVTRRALVIDSNKNRAAWLLSVLGEAGMDAEAMGHIDDAEFALESHAITLVITEAQHIQSETLGDVRAAGAQVAICVRPGELEDERDRDDVTWLDLPLRRTAVAALLDTLPAPETEVPIEARPAWPGPFAGTLIPALRHALSAGHSGTLWAGLGGTRRAVYIQDGVVRLPLLPTLQRARLERAGVLTANSARTAVHAQFAGGDGLTALLDATQGAAAAGVLVATLDATVDELCEFLTQPAHQVRFVTTPCPASLSPQHSVPLDARWLLALCGAYVAERPASMQWLEAHGHAPFAPLSADGATRMQQFKIAVAHAASLAGAAASGTPAAVFAALAAFDGLRDAPALPEQQGLASRDVSAIGLSADASLAQALEAAAQTTLGRKTTAHTAETWPVLSAFTPHTRPAADWLSHTSVAPWHPGTAEAGTSSAVSDAAARQVARGTALWMAGRTAAGALAYRAALALDPDIETAADALAWLGHTGVDVDALLGPAARAP